MSRVALSLASELASVTSARHAACDALRAWELADLVDDVQLAVAELVANAVRHSDTAVEVVLERHADRLEVSVLDPQPRMLPPRTTDEHLPETGRGLRLVGAVAHDWGVEPAGDGKRVWCSFLLDQDRGTGAHVLHLAQHRAGEVSERRGDEAGATLATG